MTHKQNKTAWTPLYQAPQNPGEDAQIKVEGPGGDAQIKDEVEEKGSRY